MGADAVGSSRSRRRERGVRRIAIRAIAALLPLSVMVGLQPVVSSPRALASQEGATEAMLNVELPPALGETGVQVYIAATGHTLSGIMLDYWRATGGSVLFGNPISEPFAAPNGYYSQAFERGVLQYRPDVLHTVEPIVRLMPLGQMALSEGVGTVGADGRRANGGGNPQVSTWGALPIDSVAVTTALAAGGIYVDATGHTISGEFLAWYERHEGQFYLGNPLSEPMTDDGQDVQWFEGGMLVRDAKDRVSLAPLPADLAAAIGVDPTRVPRNGLPDYSEALFIDAVNPTGGDPIAAPGPKLIEVDLSEQRLWAYQGDTLVTTSLVTTGLSPNDTEQGWFRVRYKKPLEDMAGFTDATGEVVAVDDGSEQESPSGGEGYEVTDVPNVMYFNLDAEALHGAYWRDVFGAPGSHGCVNLPLDVAAFLYGWAPLGTPVWVHE